MTFVIPAAKGGGSDKLTRFWVGIDIKSNYADRKIKLLNKPGGAGAVAMQYLRKNSGNGKMVLAVSNFLVTTPLFQKLPWTFRDFTPIVMLADDNFVLWVHVDSPWNTAQEFIREAKQRSIKVGGTGSKQEDEIIFRGMQEAAGTRPFRYVPFKGGGAVAKALTGKKLEATVNQVSEAGGYYPEMVRPLCVVQDERLDIEGLMDVPTCIEAGIPISYHYIRGVVAPPDIPEEDRVELVKYFRALADDADWQQFTEKVGMRRTFLTGDQYSDLLEDFEEVNRRILSDQGWIR